MNSRSPEPPTPGTRSSEPPVDAASRLVSLLSGAQGATLAGLVPVLDPLRSDALARSLGAGTHPLVESLRPIVAAFGRDGAAAGSRPRDVLCSVSSAVAQLPLAQQTDLDINALHEIALTAWADEHARLSRLDQCLDGFTGLHTDAYLRTRLAQVYAQCAPLGVRPSAAWALVSVRLQFGEPAPLEALAALDALVHVLREQFVDGETVAVLTRTTCVVLVPCHAVADHAMALELTLSVDPTLAELPWRVVPAPLSDHLTDSLETLDGLVR